MRAICYLTLMIKLQSSLVIFYLDVRPSLLSWWRLLLPWVDMKSTPLVRELCYLDLIPGLLSLSETSITWGWCPDYALHEWILYLCLISILRADESLLLPGLHAEVTGLIKIFGYLALMARLLTSWELAAYLDFIPKLLPSSENTVT